MGNERKEIIIDEIKYWKQSKLLPSEYCDFLIMLYTQGEGLTEQKDQRRKQQRSLWFFIDLTFLLLLIPVSFFVVLFYDTSMIVNLFITLGVLLILGVHYVYYKKSNTVYVHLPIILFFLMFLVGNIKIVQQLMGIGMILNVTIFLHCLVWLMFGYWKRLYYLVASGIVGIILLIINLFVI